MSLNILKRLQISIPKCLDPIYANDTISREIIDNTYDKLFAFKGTSCVKVLVEQWEKKTDTLYWFKLKENIYFHDGTLCNSISVKKSLTRMLNHSPKGNIIFDGIFKKEKIICLGKFEFVIELEKPTSHFENYLAIQEASIINPKIFSENEGQTLKCINGTGAFQLENINYEKREVSLRKFPKYWGENIFFDKILIKSESDYEKRKNLFLKEYDIMAVQASELPDIETYANIRCDSFFALDLILFTLNIKNNELRKAIKYSFNYDFFLEKYRRHLGIRIGSAIPKGVMFYEQNTDLYPFNLTEAKNIISHLEKDNITLKILTVKGMEDARKACELLVDGLVQIGIGSSIEEYEFSTYCEMFDNGLYDIAFLSYAPDIINVDNFLRDFYSSKGEVAASINFYDTEIEKLLNIAKNETNYSIKAQIIRKIINQAENSNPYVWLYQGKNLKIHKNNLTNITHNVLDGDYNFKSIYRRENMDEL